MELNEQLKKMMEDVYQIGTDEIFINGTYEPHLHVIKEIDGEYKFGDILDLSHCPKRETCSEAHTCESGIPINEALMWIQSKQASHVIMCGVMTGIIATKGGKVTSEIDTELLLCSLLDSTGADTVHVLINPVKTANGTKYTVDSDMKWFTEDVEDGSIPRMIPPWNIKRTPDEN